MCPGHIEMLYPVVSIFSLCLFNHGHGSVADNISGKVSGKFNFESEKAGELPRMYSLITMD